MKKIIISGSIAFQSDYELLAKSFTEKGYQIINYPKPNDNLVEEYPAVFADFFKSIEEADVFYLYNKKRKGISGYIGAAGFAEATYALCQKLIHNKEIKIILAEQPSKEVQCYDEIELWKQHNWLTIEPFQNIAPAK